MVCRSVHLLFFEVLADEVIAGVPELALKLGRQTARGSSGERGARATKTERRGPVGGRGCRYGQPNLRKIRTDALSQSIVRTPTLPTPWYRV